MSSSSPDVVWHDSGVSRDDRWRTRDVHGATVWFTGLSGSGKSTIASAVAVELTARRAHVHARRRQPAPRPERRPRVLRRGPHRERAPGRGGGAPLRRFRRGRARPAHQPVPSRTGAGARAPRGGRASRSSRCSSTRRSRCAKRATRRASTPKRARVSSRGFTGIDDPYEPPGSADLVLPASEISPYAGAASVVELLVASGVVPARRGS